MDSSFVESRSLEALSKFKFHIFTGICLFMHISLFVYCLLFSVMPLMIINIGSILCYVICFALLKKGKTEISFYIGYIEIILHAFAATLILGHSFGFSLYFLVTVPMVFNLLHDYNDKKSARRSLILVFLSFILHTCSYALSCIYEPICHSDAIDKTVMFLFLINSLSAFVIASIFSLIFIYEADEAMNKLYNKNKELNVLANRDTLTGLYNRRTMTEHVMKMYEDYEKSHSPFALVICDIDDFKKVNDSLGHDCGDVVLKEIARVLTSLTRENDFLCRWGGEEFLILLNQIERNTAKEIAERFRTSIGDTEIRYKDTVLSVTMTFGVSDAIESDSYESMFRLADKRLYEGKENGKNQVV